MPLQSPVPQATLLTFATACDTAAASASKLHKQAVLATYFHSLDNDDDLRRAVRYAAGRAFPTTDERTLNVGSAIVNEVILNLLKIDSRVYWDTVLKSGEIGEALAKLWPKSQAAPNPFTLEELATAFDALARIGVVEIKQQLLREMFQRCPHPREAAYLAKIIFRDLRIGVQEGVLQAAVAHAFDKPLKEIQRSQLLVGDLDEVGVLARHDQLKTPTFRLFHPIQFMLATPQETPEVAGNTLQDRPFYAEDKLDGIRIQIHKSGSRVALYTRTMDRTDDCFPDVVAAISKVPGDFLLDGEIVPWQNGRVMPFAHIQKRLGRKCPSAKILRENPAAFIAFDILYLNGELLMEKPLRDRKAALDGLCHGNPHAGLVAGSPSDSLTLPGLPNLACTQATTVHNATEIAAIFEAARERGNEGIVLKDPDSVYAPGRRGKAWLKLKTHLPTLDCVVTAAEFGHGKRRNTLSDYTFAVWSAERSHPDAQLVNIGKAYSGVTDEEIAKLTELFLKISRAQHGHVHVVDPQVVLEIACDQIQKSARHASGYALRFPRIKCIRWDKRPEDADQLLRVKELYESARNFGRSVAPPAKPDPQLSLFNDV